MKTLNCSSANIENLQCDSSWLQPNLAAWVKGPGCLVCKTYLAKHDLSLVIPSPECSFLLIRHFLQQSFPYLQPNPHKLELYWVPTSCGTYWFPGYKLWNASYIKRISRTYIYSWKTTIKVLIVKCYRQHLRRPLPASAHPNLLLHEKQSLNKKCSLFILLLHFSFYFFKILNSAYIY